MNVIRDHDLISGWDGFFKLVLLIINSLVSHSVSMVTSVAFISQFIYRWELGVSSSQANAEIDSVG